MQTVAPPEQNTELVTEMAAIAHDLNNNLQIVVSSLELMRIQIGQGRISDGASLIERAVESGVRAGALSKRLLCRSKPRSTGTSRVEVNSTIMSMQPQIYAMVGSSIDIVVSLANNLRPIPCDPLGFENALLNLVINARDAMMLAGGTLSLNTCSVHLTVGLPPLRAGDYVAVFVTDTGVGMSASVLRRAFEPYFTTKAKGTGLGLSSAKAFVIAHGGHIEATSAKGEGTSIKFWLPCE
jgi:signal transduction histidine kinase